MTKKKQSPKKRRKELIHKKAQNVRPWSVEAELMSYFELASLMGASLSGLQHRLVDEYQKLAVLLSSVHEGKPIFSKTMALRTLLESRDAALRACAMRFAEEK